MKPIYVIERISLLIKSEKEISPLDINVYQVGSDKTNNDLEIVTQKELSKPISIDGTFYVPATIYAGFKYPVSKADAISIAINDYFCTEIHKNDVVAMREINCIVPQNINLVSNNAAYVKVISSEYMCFPVMDFKIDFNLYGNVIYGKRMRVIDTVEWNGDDHLFSIGIANGDNLQNICFEKQVDVMPYSGIAYVRAVSASFTLEQITAVSDLSLIYNGTINFVAILKYNNLKLSKKYISVYLRHHINATQCIYPDTKKAKLQLLGYNVISTVTKEEEETNESND